MNENTDCKCGRRSFIFYFLILRVKPSSTQSPNFHPDIDLFYDVHFFVTIGVFHTPLLLCRIKYLQSKPPTTNSYNRLAVREARLNENMRFETFSVFCRDWLIVRLLSLSCFAKTTISSVKSS